MFLTIEEINNILESKNEHFTFISNLTLDSFKNYDRMELIIKNKENKEFKGKYINSKTIHKPTTKFEFKEITYNG